MLYTGKGDNGTSKLFNSKSGERHSKADTIYEALGTVDELNSFLGLVKVNFFDAQIKIDNDLAANYIEKIQQDLFIVQAELAGSQMVISAEKIKWLEDVTNNIESKMPPITTFFISGGTECAALADIARTIARRAERQVVRVFEGGRAVSENTLAYLNRLSSVLYAFARYSNHIDGIVEQDPKYN